MTADRFEGGSVSIPVPWPAVPAPGLLRRVQDAMGARTAIDTAETVTSGFGVVLPHRSRRTGQEFLAGQPWTAGGATDATIAEQDGTRTLLFALPALGYHFALRLDDQDRIVSPNHLLTREYRYPSREAVTSSAPPAHRRVRDEALWGRGAWVRRRPSGRGRRWA